MRKANGVSARSLSMLLAFCAQGVGVVVGASVEERAAALVREVRARLDESFIVEREGIFVIAGNLPRRRFEAIRRDTVALAAQALWASYCTRRPPDPVVIYLFADGRTYRAWAKRLFGDERVSHFGYYRPAQNAMLMNIATGTGTLVHELTHALVRPDFPDIPTWFDEGLASLHEQCQVGPKGIRGLVNWRLPGLQRAIREGRLVPLAKLVATTEREFRGPNEGLHYAEARYLVMYLQHKGLLRRFYREFRRNVANDPTGARTLEAVTGKSIPELQKDWLAWVGTLRFGR